MFAVRHSVRLSRFSSVKNAAGSHCGKYVERGPLHGIVHWRQIDQGFQPGGRPGFAGTARSPERTAPSGGWIVHSMFTRRRYAEADLDGTVAAARRGADFDLQARDLGIIRRCPLARSESAGQSSGRLPQDSPVRNSHCARCSSMPKASGIGMLPTPVVKERCGRREIALRRGVSRR